MDIRNITAEELLFSNTGSVLWEKLEPRIDVGANIYITTAFFNAAEELIKISQRATIKLIVRLAYPTNGEALEDIIKTKNIQVRALRDENSPLHEKVFAITDKNNKAVGAYIGSANWTDSGLKRNTEAGVWLKSPESVEGLVTHFAKLWAKTSEITDVDIRQLKEAARLSRRTPAERAAHRGTLIASWKSLSDSNGEYYLKQNGTSETPYIEAEENFNDLRKDHASQTLSFIPKDLATGQGILLTWIARRKDGRADRLVYGRGRIAAFDPIRWRLPGKYLAELADAGLRDGCSYILQWQKIIWLDPVEIIDYPPKCEDYLWYSEITGFREFSSFRKGIRKISKDYWEKCNRALDIYTDKYKLQSPNPSGIWWNDYLGFTPTNPLYITKELIEDMNLDSGGADNK